jgi:hypothetical protein
LYRITNGEWVISEANGNNWMKKKVPPLVAGSSEIESAEDDFPSKIHGVPEFRVVESKSNHILP